MSSSQAQGLLRIKAVRTAKTSYPTGNPKFSVKQSFPAAFDEFEADPFLMCDYFNMPSDGVESDPDRFPIGWHPHRGMDICTYMKAGVGRHGDSLGSRESFSSPGMQWISVGSGVEHAEGGATPLGEPFTGFQIWINVPAKHKMDDPDYGTVDPKTLPLLVKNEGNVHCRVLAGPLPGEDRSLTGEVVHGPFRTKQALQMVDYMLRPAQSIAHHVLPELDNCLAYVYEGQGTINGQRVAQYAVLQFEADAKKGVSQRIEDRVVQITSDADAPMSVLLFAGKRINEKIAWQGPFVMNTQEELHQTMREYRSGNFPPKRVPWDYRRLAAFPTEKQREIRENDNTCRAQSSLDKTDCL